MKNGVTADTIHCKSQRGILSDAEMQDRITAL